MMNNSFQGHYRPEMLPGGSSGRPDVDTNSANPRGTSLSGIESRLRTIRSDLSGADTMLRAFFNADVPTLMAIARAADSWANATNAETQRRAGDGLRAGVRGLNMSGIQSRVHSLRGNSVLVGANPDLRAFLWTDSTYLLAVARAAQRWAQVSVKDSDNALRDAAANLQATVRGR